MKNKGGCDNRFFLENYNQLNDCYKCLITELAVYDSIHDFFNKTNNILVTNFIYNVFNNIYKGKLDCSNDEYNKIYRNIIEEHYNNKENIEKYCKNLYGFRHLNERMNPRSYTLYRNNLYISDTYFINIDSSSTRFNTYLYNNDNNIRYPNRYNLLLPNVRNHFNIRSRKDYFKNIINYPELDFLFLTILKQYKTADNKINIMMDNNELFDYIIYLKNYLERSPRLNYTINIIKTTANIFDGMFDFCNRNLSCINKPLEISAAKDFIIFKLDKFSLSTQIPIDTPLCNNRNEIINIPNNNISYSIINQHNDNIITSQSISNYINAIRLPGLFNNPLYRTIGTTLTNTESRRIKSNRLDDDYIYISEDNFKIYTKLINRIKTIFNLHIDFIPHIIQINKRDIKKKHRTIIKNRDLVDVKIYKIRISSINTLITILFDFKRLGDYSQILLAYKNKCIFMTNDRLASIYAFLLKVPCIIPNNYEFLDHDFATITFINFDNLFETNRHLFVGGTNNSNSNSKPKPNSNSKSKSNSKKIKNSKFIFIEFLNKYTFDKDSLYFNEFLKLLIIYNAYIDKIINNDNINYNSDEIKKLKIIYKNYIDKFILAQYT